MMQRVLTANTNTWAYHFLSLCCDARKCCGQQDVAVSQGLTANIGMLLGSMKIVTGYAQSTMVHVLYHVR